MVMMGQLDIKLQKDDPRAPTSHHTEKLTHTEMVRSKSIKT